MSSKHKTPRKPENKLVTRGDVINFMNFMSTDEAFCLRVWNTVQGVYARAQAEEDAAAAATAAEASAASEPPVEIPSDAVAEAALV